VDVECVERVHAFECRVRRVEPGVPAHAALDEAFDRLLGTVGVERVVRWGS